MKKMIIISMFLGIVCSKGYGQFTYNTITDSLSLNFDSTRLLEWRNSIVIDSFPMNIVSTSVTPKYDTVPVLMLVSDSARKYRIDESIYIDTIHPTPFKYNDSTIYSGFKLKRDTVWREPYEGVIQYFGNEVRLIENICCDPNNTLNAAWYNKVTHVKYLDKNKKELPKKIVIWLSQPLIKNK